MFLYEDESHIRDDQDLGFTWSPREKQKQISTYGHHATVSLFGCVSSQNGEFFCMEKKKCNAQSFRSFLHFLLSVHQDKHLVIILDNARIPHAKLLKPFLKENAHRLTCLPTLLS
ncbi:hypothetical protein CEW92_00565 [Bacillaceae bacterium SAS-127]|nr:hypothetical protein CEW92_00565 [Bacillaceae bacterium SAS-127]